MRAAEAGIVAGPKLVSQPNAAQIAAGPAATGPTKAKPTAAYQAAPPVHASRFKLRHGLLALSFVVGVMLPAIGSYYYLWFRTAAQYASTVAFSVRSEEVSSAIELLGGITELSGSSSSDTDILYEFIQSQKLVTQVDEAVDLRSMWSKPQNDPIFSYSAPGTIEDLVTHWDRMIKIYYDSGTKLIEVRALAFDPQDATRISESIYRFSSEMINQLSAIAREDSIRYARADLNLAVERLKEARAALTEFRNRTQIVDPVIDFQSQASLLGSLQTQLAQAQIEVDVLRETTQAGDPRMEQALRRVRVIDDRMEQERRKVGIGNGTQDGQVYANLVGEYERLIVDREFAETTYTGALAAYDGALAQAQRQNRYLAAYVLPTRAERSDYPKRLTLLGVITLFSFLTWSIVVLVAYALRDRR